MICKNCQLEIETEVFVTCRECKNSLHDDCKNRCIKCFTFLCDECALKGKFKCSTCNNIIQHEMEFISSTMFESFLKCPYAFKHTMLVDDKYKTAMDDHENDNKYNVVGNLLHDLFEKYAPIRPLPSDIKIAQECTLLFKELNMDLFDGEEDYNLFLNRSHSTIRNWCEEELAKQTPLFVEAKHFVTLHPELPPIRVTIDRINGEMDKVDEWEVEDYKTGKVYAGQQLANNMQLPIYAMAIQKVYGALPIRLKLYFPQHQQYREFERITDDIYVCSVKRGGTYSISLSQKLQQMVDIYKQIKKGEFIPNAKNEYFCNNFCKLGISGDCFGVSTKWGILKQRMKAMAKYYT